MSKRKFDDLRRHRLTEATRMLWPGLAILITTVLATSLLYSDETHARYFDQLRQRGLFSLAETEAISRLAADNLSLAAKTSFTIELSKTLTEHAGFVSDEQREELWLRAKTTIQELLDQDRANPRSVLLNAQLASVFANEGEWLRGEREIRPFDEQLLKRARAACSNAIEQLQAIEKALTEPSRDSPAKKPGDGGPLGHELRALLHRVRWQLGQTNRNLAELAAAGSVERTTNASDAEQTLRKLVGVADEPVQTRAKILLASCSRLKGNLDRASEMIASLEKAESPPNETVLDDIAVERVRILLDRQLPTEAAELLVKTRARRQRLTGELWLLQTRTVIALRDIAVEKQQQKLADRLSEQITTTIERCEEQVGGYWSRRCRQLWDNAQTTQKYGAELDSLMQQARADFMAGRIESALTEYSSGEKAAVNQGLLDLAMELGFTHASILLDQKQFDSAAAEFLRLAQVYPTQPRAAKSHLLGAYCLGRLYDEKKTQTRREAYTDSLNRHLTIYEHDPTVNDALFMKAQLEEQRLQATQALPLYLQIEPNHAKAVDAISGAARCYETILRRMHERRLSADDFENEAIDRLSKYLSLAGDRIDAWTVTDAEVALRLAAILLMESSASATLNVTSRSDENRVEPRVKPSNLARSDAAEHWLSQVASFADRRDSDPAFAASNDALRQRIAPLRIVALAGIGKFADAERTLNSLSTSPAKMLAIVERLTRIMAATNPSEQIRLASLQVSAAERLIPLRDQLSADERDQLERCLARSYIAAGQFTKAAEMIKRLSEVSAKDVDRQRELAQLVSDVKNPEAYALAKQCWRRVESLTKPGSSEWMTARLGVLNSCVRLHQFDEARKLMQVTRVLYPDLGGASLKVQFDAVNQDLQSETGPPR